MVAHTPLKRARLPVPPPGPDPLGRLRNRPGSLRISAILQARLVESIAAVPNMQKR